MEQVEEATKEAVASCHRVLNLLSQQQHDQIQPRRVNLAAEAGEAVSKFKTVISLLNNNNNSNAGLGHARVRKHKRLPILLPHSILLDSPNCHVSAKASSHSLHHHDAASNAKTSLCLLELGSGGKASPIHQAIPITVAAVSQQQQHYHSLQQQQQQQQRMMLQQHMKHQAEMAFRKSSSSINSGVNLNFDSSSCTPTMSSTRSFISSLSIDASVANMDGSATAAFHLIGAPRSSDQNSQNKRKCSAKGDDGSMKCSASGRCHCSKKRKHRVKRSIKVPAISNKLADIPPDDYSWRKYGQKPIKGSPHPRGYYKCSSMRGCPARKHVERCLEESSMLIVTYEGEHNHPRAPSQSATNT